jgi:hypothetical protein
MPETKLIKEFPVCPNCGSSELISKLGCAGLVEKGKIKADAPTHLEVQVIPIEQPMMAGVMVSAIVIHWDICAGCGRRRCTWADVQQVPVQMQGGMPRGGSSMNFPKYKG